MRRMAIAVLGLSFLFSVGLLVAGQARPKGAGDKRVCERPPFGGMGVPPMQHRRDADATESHGQDARATSHTPA